MTRQRNRNIKEKLVLKNYMKYWQIKKSAQNLLQKRIYEGLLWYIKRGYRENQMKIKKDMNEYKEQVINNQKFR